jgi:hypothetical protein
MSPHVLPRLRLKTRMKSLVKIESEPRFEGEHEGLAGARLLVRRACLLGQGIYPHHIFVKI